MSQPKSSESIPAKPDLQTAPRTMKKVLALGIFRLRLLLEMLGYLQSEPEKMAFAKMSTEEKALLVLRLLHDYDTVFDAIRSMRKKERKALQHLLYQASRAKFSLETVLHMADTVGNEDKKELG